MFVIQNYYQLNWVKNSIYALIVDDVHAIWEKFQSSGVLAGRGKRRPSDSVDIGLWVGASVTGGLRPQRDVQCTQMPVIYLPLVVRELMTKGTIDCRFVP